MKKYFLSTALCILLFAMTLLLLSACKGAGTGTSEGEDAALSFRANADGTYTVVGIGSLNGARALVIPETYRDRAVTVIGYGAFQNCRGLESVEIPKGITSIGRYAFDGCTGLVSVSFAEGSRLQTIGERAFYGCERLVSVTVPQRVASIGAHAFYGCKGLRSVSFCAESRLQSVSPSAFAHCTALESVDFGSRSRLTSISAYAFSGCTRLQSVSFGEGSQLKNIGNAAFELCVALKDVALPEGTVNIGDHAFSDCVGIVSLTVPGSVAYIGDRAFSGCYKLVELYNLSSLEIKKGASTYGGIGAYAFDVYTSADSQSKLWTDADGFVFYENGTLCYLLGYGGQGGEVTLPSDCHGKSYAVYKNAFYCHEGLFRVTVPDGVVGIGDSAFRGCAGLTSVSLSDSVTSIGWYAFAQCTALEAVNFGEHSRLESIDYAAFYHCIGLQGFTIPESVRVIGGQVFAHCTGLRSITITENVTSLGDAFYGCANLESVYFNATAVSYAKAGTFYGAGSGAGGLEITVGKDVTAIPADLFCDGESIVFVTFEEGSVCAYIGERAFSGCVSLESVTIPEGVRYIGAAAFKRCTALKEILLYAVALADLKAEDGAFEGAGVSGPGIRVTVGASVTSIPAYLFYAGTASAASKITAVVFEQESACSRFGAYAFSGCTSLAVIDVPLGVTDIGVLAFDRCTSLAYSEYDNAYYLGNQQNPYMVLVRAKDPSVVSCRMHADTRVIAGAAFLSCADLKSVVFSANVITVGDSAFERCSVLERVTVPESVRRIGERAFADCISLLGVSLAEGTHTVGDRAFEGCTALTRLVIPQSVQVLGTWVFYRCAALTVYCRTATMPGGWAATWNPDGQPVRWGYAGN